MSQYYPQQPRSLYPPAQNPEEEYDEDDYEYIDDENDDQDENHRGDTLAQRALIFFAGGCLVFLCMSCCALVGLGVWSLDPGSSLLAATPPPGSDVGLSFSEPAYPDESVVNENNVQLAILDVNRNAALATVPVVEGRELIIVTVELVNLGDEEVDYTERNFMLLNQNEEAYTSTSGVIDGALDRGTLPPAEGLEGRLVFEVLAGEPDLILTWEGGPDSQARYIYLQ